MNGLMARRLLYILLDGVLSGVLLVPNAGGQGIPNQQTGVREPASSTEFVVDDFEGVKPTWRVLDSPTLAAPARVRRTDAAPFAGLRCELISALGNRGGERILAVHSIPPVAAIKELVVRAQVRGNRPGFQLLARVRLPRTRDQDGQPLSFFIHGDTYSSPASWQELALTDVDRKVGDGVRALRIERGEHLNAAQAYIDQVALNVYGGAKQNIVWVDNLALEAAVRVDSDPVRPTKPATPFVQLASHAVASHAVASHREADLRVSIGQNPASSNEIARVITHRGESFAFLKQLGFNTIWLSAPATPSQLGQAEELGLWLICPPPDANLTTSIDRFHRVIAWEDSPESTDSLRQRKFDPFRRPTISRNLHGSTANDTHRSRGTRNLSVTYGALEAGNRHDWVAIGNPLLVSSRWVPLRNRTWDAVTAGCRHFVVETGQNIEQRSGQHAARLAELMNLELRMLRPWIEDTEAERLFDVSPSSAWHTSVVSNNHSGLVFVRPRTQNRTERRALTQSNWIEIPTARYRDAFRVEPGALSPVAWNRVAGGIRLTLNRSKPDGLLLLTDRSTIVQSVFEHVHQAWPRHRELLVGVLQTELLDLNRRIDHSTEATAFKSHLRREVHALHGRIAPMLEDEGTATFRELDHVLGQLERAQRRLMR